ncbi:hypothetical protein H6G89_12125 [Oscillatoria sp. FACHB-1407]|nr:hypothetical protein [Oscillatoria sp. FACHB-1407]
MQISMERSGGFTGIPLVVTVDTVTLSPAEAEHLRQLVNAADFFRLPEAIADTPQPDRFHYQITVQDNGQHHTVSVSESAMPAGLRPLVQWLTAAARRR